jgi:hypothetical protein
MIDKNMLISKLEFAKSIEDSYTTILESFLEEKISEVKIPEDVVNLMIQTIDYLKIESILHSKLVFERITDTEYSLRDIYKDLDGHLNPNEFKGLINFLIEEEEDHNIQLVSDVVKLLKELN